MFFQVFQKYVQHIIEDDEGLYGIDEILALSIVNVYGTIDGFLCSDWRFRICCFDSNDFWGFGGEYGN